MPVSLKRGRGKAEAATASAGCGADGKAVAAHVGVFSNRPVSNARQVRGMNREMNGIMVNHPEG
jgi:hypothetical protein